MCSPLTHTHRLHSCVCCVRWASYAGRLLIWLYPNECNSVFSNWRQQDAPVIQPMPVDPTRSTSQTSTPGAPSPLSGGELRIQTPWWVTYDGAVTLPGGWTAIHMYSSQKQTHRVGVYFVGVEGETPLLGLFSRLFSSSPSASIFVSNVLW